MGSEPFDDAHLRSCEMVESSRRVRHLELDLLYDGHGERLEAVSPRRRCVSKALSTHPAVMS